MPKTLLIVPMEVPLKEISKPLYMSCQMYAREYCDLLVRSLHGLLTKHTRVEDTMLNWISMHGKWLYTVDSSSLIWLRNVITDAMFYIQVTAPSVTRIMGTVKAIDKVNVDYDEFNLRILVSM